MILMTYIEPRPRKASVCEQALVDGLYAELIVFRSDGTYRICRPPEAMLESPSGCTRALGRMLLELARQDRKAEAAA